MRGVKALPEAVRSSIRSGVVLYDVARVVEELVFNSLDAGARKVSVLVGIETCYVKVVDDGCGITRDGLVLLGERYATSKFEQFTEADGGGGSFGSRGEVLASISDVALLEVVTKASGRPNGYRKAMKGFKCLFLGVDDDRKDVGTTVVVRDLFYNQPVRRKCKQHFYINSRFICKGPIKKLLNQLASSFEWWEPGTAVVESSNRKRSRPQAFPVYVLNLSCPQSMYDLNFEPSKTYAEFKDWDPVLNFIEKAIQSFWKEKIFYDMLDVDLSEMSPIGKKRSGVEDIETSPDVMKIISKEDSDLSQRRYDRIPFDYFHKITDDVKGFKDRDSDIDFGHDTDYSFRQRDHSCAKCMLRTTLKTRENHSWMPDINISPDEDHMMDPGCPAAQRSSDTVTSPWQDQPLKRRASVGKGSAVTGVSHHDFSSSVGVTFDVRQPFIKSCSSRGRILSERDLFTESGIKCHVDNQGSKRMRSGPYNRAIMFGDSLLPSECSLIVEELKETSLCFQCAHDRPTTAPLVNLEALHKQIAKIASLNRNHVADDQSWHGLRRHELSLARAEQRLNSARS